PEVAFWRDLLLFDPGERFQPGLKRFVVAEDFCRFDQRLAETGIVVAYDCLEPCPVGTTAVTEQADENRAAVFKHGARCAMIRLTAQDGRGTQHRKRNRAG